MVQPQQTEGPYFVDGVLNRADIRTEPPSGPAKPGVPLTVTFNVCRWRRRAPARRLRARTSISGSATRSVSIPGVKDRSFDTIGQKFLRGYQLTDAKGGAKFVTIYPGWYQGRAVHVHFKIRTNPRRSGRRSSPRSCTSTKR